MKKAAFIALSTTLTLFMVGHFFVYKAVIKNHKKEFKSYMRGHYDKLQKIEINPSQLYTDSKTIQWLDKNNEVMIQGVLYDIAFIKNTGKTITLFVITDSLEKSLFDKYCKIANSLNDTHSGKSDVSKNLVSLKYLSQKPLLTKIYFSVCDITIFCSTPYLQSGFETLSIKPPIS